MSKGADIPECNPGDLVYVAITTAHNMYSIGLVLDKGKNKQIYRGFPAVTLYINGRIDAYIQDELYSFDIDKL